MAAEVDTGMDKAQLKKLLAMSKRDPVNCAVGINGGQGVIMLDRVKQPKAVEKDLAKKFPDLKNPRWGTAFVDVDENPKLVILTLNKTVAGLARSLKKSLKGTGFSQVEIRLEDGSVAEKVSDEEEAAASPDGAPPPAAEAPEGVEAAGEQDDAAPPDGAPPAAGKDDDAESPPTQAAEDTDGAETTPAEATPAEATPAETTPAEPDIGDLTRRLTDLVKQVIEATTSDPSRKAELGTLAAQAQAALKAGDPATAASAMDQLDAALAGGAPADAPDTAGTPAQPDIGELTRRLTGLVKQVIAASTSDPSRKAGLGTLAAQAQAALKAGDPATAAGSMDQLEAALAGGAPAGASDTASPAAPSVNPAAMAKARVAWIATRQKVESDIDNVYGTFNTAFKDHPVGPDLGAAFKARADKVLDSLDEALAEKLDEVTKTTDPAQHAKIAQEARQIIQRYEATIASDPTIAALDENPFVAVTIRKTMTATLSALSRAIA